MPTRAELQHHYNTETNHEVRYKLIKHYPMLATEKNYDNEDYIYIKNEMRKHNPSLDNASIIENNTSINSYSTNITYRKALEKVKIEFIDYMDNENLIMNLFEACEKYSITLEKYKRGYTLIKRDSHFSIRVISAPNFITHDIISVIKMIQSLPKFKKYDVIRIIND